MRLVVIESPFAGDVELHLRYLRAAMADCLARGEAPFASHGLYTQPGVLDDTDPAQRRFGMEAGFAWGAVSAATVVYVNIGISPGMRLGIDLANEAGRTVDYRWLPEPWPQPELDDVAEQLEATCASHAASDRRSAAPRS